MSFNKDSKEFKEEVAKSVLDSLKNIIPEIKSEIKARVREDIDTLFLSLRNSISQASWKMAQQNCIWDSDDHGPTMMPNKWKFFYRIGNHELVITEEEPMNRTVFMHNSLFSEDADKAVLESKKGESVLKSLAFPYVQLYFKFENRRLTKLYCTFTIKPLSFEEKIGIPMLPNIDDTLSVCLGNMDFDQIEGKELREQVEYVSNYFWNSNFVDELSYNYWKALKFFKEKEVKQLSSLSDWIKTTEEDPMFVVELDEWPYFKNDQNSALVGGEFAESLMVGAHAKDQFRIDIYDKVIKHSIENIISQIPSSVDGALESILKDENIKSNLA